MSDLHRLLLLLARQNNRIATRTTTLTLNIRIHLDGPITLFRLKYHAFVLSIAFFNVIVDFNIRKLSYAQFLRQIESVHQSFGELLLIEKGILTNQFIGLIVPPSPLYLNSRHGFLEDTEGLESKPFSLLLFLSDTTKIPNFFHIYNLILFGKHDFPIGFSPSIADQLRAAFHWK